MKGVVFSTSFFILILSVFLSLSQYIYYENNRAIINNNFKKSILQTAALVKNDPLIKEGDILEILKEEILLSLPNQFEYEFELLGYHENPLLLRIRLRCFNHPSKEVLSFEETIIEKEYEYEKNED